MTLLEKPTKIGNGSGEVAFPVPHNGDERTVINDDRLYEAIGERLKSVRKNHHLTQARMAKYLGLERTSVTNFERNRQRPSVHILYHYCEHFVIAIADLLPPIEDMGKQRMLPPGAEKAREKARRSLLADSI